MKFLIDECLRQRLAVALNDLGHDAIHVTEVDLAGRPDHDVMNCARREDRVTVSADTDFGELLATTHATAPSVVLFRGQSHSVDNLTQLTSRLLPEVETDLHDLPRLAPRPATHPGSHSATVNRTLTHPRRLSHIHPLSLWALMGIEIGKAAGAQERPHRSDGA